MSDEKTNLVKKLVAACEAVKGVEKRGHNLKQNYNYVKASDVAKAMRKELFKRGVLILSDEKELYVSGTVKTNSGGEMRELTLRVEYVILDSESSERLTVNAFGVAMDTGDKAVYKAKTGALKYFLRGLGLIPDEKSDPEGDEKVDRETSDYEGEFERKTEGQRVLGEFQVRAWESAVEKGCRTTSQVVAHFNKLGIKSIHEMLRADFNDSIKWLLDPKAGEMVNELKDSVENAKKQNGKPFMTKERLATLHASGKPHGKSHEFIHDMAAETYQVGSLSDLNESQYNELLKWAGTPE